MGSHRLVTQHAYEALDLEHVQALEGRRRGSRQQLRRRHVIAAGEQETQRRPHLPAALVLGRRALQHERIVRGQRGEMVPHRAGQFPPLAGALVKGTPASKAAIEVAGSAQRSVEEAPIEKRQPVPPERVAPCRAGASVATAASRMAATALESRPRWAATSATACRPSPVLLARATASTAAAVQPPVASSTARDSSEPTPRPKPARQSRSVSSGSRRRSAALNCRCSARRRRSAPSGRRRASTRTC